MSKIAKKSTRIKREEKRLKELLEGIDENKKDLAEPLISNAAFMRVTLEDLQIQINEEGAVITTTNGNGFDVTQEHPAQKSYNQMITRYTGVIKQLLEIAPEAAKKKSKLGAFLDE